MAFIDVFSFDNFFYYDLKKKKKKLHFSLKFYVWKPIVWETDIEKINKSLYLWEHSKWLRRWFDEIMLRSGRRRQLELNE